LQAIFQKSLDRMIDKMNSNWFVGAPPKISHWASSKLTQPAFKQDVDTAIRVQPSKDSLELGKVPFNEDYVESLNEEELIDQIMNSSNSLSFLKLIENLQTYISFVNSIEISSNRALNVVNDLRLNIKNQNSIKSHVNLKENISSVLNVFNFELEEKNNINCSNSLHNKLIKNKL
jgi:hypothetical protein